MPIRQLPPLLVNQIAAGEVIERPASVVKELIENAIDAKALRIEVTIEDGGRELIQVRDDGQGIPAADLPLAVAPHATSKIEQASDLDAIATMGFRGEALASIASVSRLRIISRAAGCDEGAVLEAEGATVGRIKPHAAAPGTTITVRNLFFNTPARRKFLRTASTEASRIAEVVESIALAHPHVAFTLAVDDRVRVDLPAEENPKRRVLGVLGGELEPQLLELHFDRADDRGLMIWGMIGRPEIARPSANHQRLYLNGRPIRDRSLQHALKEAYRGLIEPGRYPTLVLFLEMNPREVDVNVHPAKAEVRFRNQTMVHGTVLGAVRQRLREADLTPTFNLGRALGGSVLQPEFGTGVDDDAGSRAEGESSGSIDHDRADAQPPAAPASPREFVDYLRRLDPVRRGDVYREVKQAIERESPEIARAVMGEVPSRSEISSRQGTGDAAEGDALPMIRAAMDILQVHSNYLVTQDDQGLIIIDQHALHERVMFERLVERVQRSNLESQHLLMPEVIEVDRAAVERIDDLRPLLERIGIVAEAMGPASIAVHAFPTFLIDRGVEIGPFVKELFARAVDDSLSVDVEAALHETLDMMACKAAVKAGDRLSREELTELLGQRERIERSSNCPHGRPTSLRLSIAELNRQFGRSAR